MEHVIAGIYRYTGNITNPNMRSVKCFSCGRVAQRTKRFGGVIPVAGWYVLRPARISIWCYCPECGEKKVRELRELRELRARGQSEILQIQLGLEPEDR